MNDHTMNKKAFLIFKSSLSVLDALTDEQAGKLFKAVRAWQEGTLIESDLDQLTALLFVPFREQFKYNDERYSEAIKSNQ